MNIDIPSLLRVLEIDDRSGRARAEAETVLRLSRTKCQGLGKNEGLRSYLATDLALGKLGIAFSREKLVKAAHSREKTYNDAYGRMRNILGSQVAAQGGKIEHLAVKFAGGSAERSRSLLQQYQRVCRSMVTAEMGDRLDFDAPTYHAAAFRVATVEAKMRVARKALADEVKMDPQELDRICVDIVRKCGLGGSEYIAKTFRLAIPSYEDEEWEGKGKGKGKGKRLSPQQGRGGAGAQIEPSPTLTTTSRLGVPGSSSPLPQEKAGRSGVLPEKRLDFPAAAAASSAAPPGVQVPPRSDGSRANDPNSSLKSFVKRLQRVESPAYDEWVKQALA